MGGVNGAAQWRPVWRFPKKPKLEPPYDPAVPPRGLCPQETPEEMSAPLCPAASCTAAKAWEQSVSLDR